MGQEHASYIAGYPDKLRVDFLCDPHMPSLQKCSEMLLEFQVKANNKDISSIVTPQLVHDEETLLTQYVHEIDLLVICSPNYLHTSTLLRWGSYPHLTILVEKPVAVSQEQIDALRHTFVETNKAHARIWVAMEYRFMPAVAKLIELLPMIGPEVKMCTIRENRFQFLHKIGRWNRDRSKTGDTLVEKWYVIHSLVVNGHHIVSRSLSLTLHVQLPFF